MSALNKARRGTRTATVLIGDARALQTGRIGQRIVNRLAGRIVARLMGKVWR